MTDVEPGPDLVPGLLGQTEVQTLHHGGESERAESSRQDLPHVAPGVDLVVGGTAGVELVLQLPVSPGEEGGDGSGLEEPHLSPLRDTELNIQSQVQFSAEIIGLQSSAQLSPAPV